MLSQHIAKSRWREIGVYIFFNPSYVGRHLGHYGDVIMGVLASKVTSLTSVYSTVYSEADQRKHQSSASVGAMASQITSFTIVYLTIYSGADQRKHQSSASLAFVRGIHRWQGNSPHKWPVTRKMFPIDDVIIVMLHLKRLLCLKHDDYFHVKSNFQIRNFARS